MRARKNEATMAILAALTKGPQTAEAIATFLNTKVPKVSMILLKLVRFGHATREKIEDGIVVMDAQEKIVRPRYVHVYSITDKGDVRLDYLKALEAVKATLKKPTRK